MNKEPLSFQTKTTLTINNRYIINDLDTDYLDQGGIGVVYKALDTNATSEDEKYVVVKLLHQGLIHDKWITNKFSKEAKAIVEKIKHEGVVLGKESGILEDGRPYLVMEYINGESLRNLVKKHPEGIELERSANILKQFGCALSAIHKANVYHRDLKPDNIMLYFKEDKEFIKIIDFGIATVKESSNEKTKTTEIIVGTPAYMAPEQIMQGKPSAKSDIYAMGVIAYEMLTGCRPFSFEDIRENPYVVLYQLQKAGLKVTPKQLRSDLSSKTEKLILQALEFDSNKRFSSAEEFGDKIYKALLEPLNQTSLEPTTTTLETIIEPTSQLKSTNYQSASQKSNYLTKIIMLVILLVIAITLGKILFSN